MGLNYSSTNGGERGEKGVIDGKGTVKYFSTLEGNISVYGTTGFTAYIRKQR